MKNTTFALMTILALVFSILTNISSAFAQEGDYDVLLEGFEGTFHNAIGYGAIPNGWSVDGSDKVEYSQGIESHHGNYGLRAVVENDPDYYAAIKKTISMEPGAIINLRIQIMVSTASSAEAVLDASYRVGNTTYYHAAKKYWYSSTTGWEEMTIKDIEIPPNGELPILLMMNHNSQFGSTQFDWDCLSLTYLPEISVSPLQFAVGDVVKVGKSQRQGFEISNVGKGDLKLGSLEIIGRDKNHFNLVYDDCSGQTIPSSGTRAVEVEFNPLSAGDKAAQLEIPSNDPDNPTLVVPLSGTATGSRAAGWMILLLGEGE
jgi:hypothetical protein